MGLGAGWVHSLAWEIVLERSQTHLWDGDGVRTDFPLVEPGEEVEHRHQRRLRREAEGFVLRDDTFERYFKPAPNDPTLFKLAHLRDRHGNTIALEYNAMGVLARIIDCVGRVIQVGSDHRGHITHLAIHNAASQGQLIYAARYSYDETGRLVRATDAGNYGND